MPQDRIVELDGIQHHFPSDATDAEIAASLGEAGSGPSANGVGPGLTTMLAAESVPAAGRLLSTFAAAPNAARTGGAWARGATTLAGVIHGAVTGNIPEIVASPIAGWQAGKGGYWLTKHAQEAAKPVGGFLGKLAPAAETVSRAIAPQGVLDLAQMAEPNRKDIGFMGIGGGTPDPEHPAMLNDIAARVRDLVMSRLRGQ